ncbi:transcription termination factor 2-like [Drosophila innubila]|uniref:transcription termination factor 2-like n=1 Tax=Drosophila innubila TaxID=198719 RepID=UPI00148BB12B|nr:transcription termination factor 2-like [Drosophila innubila]
MYSNSEEYDSDEEELAASSARGGFASRSDISGFSDSEDEEEEDELDQRGLSPRTLMSITGVRPLDMSDDSSEIDYSDEEQPGAVSPGNASADETYDEDVEREEAAAERYRRATDNDALSPYYSTQFVEDSLFPTLSPIAEKQQKHRSPRNDSSDSDVLLLSNKKTTIEIPSSSDNDDSYKENVLAPPTRNRKSRDNSPRSGATAPRVKPSKLVQPTIKAAIKKVTPTQRVSPDFYEKESKKLSDLHGELKEALKMYEKVSHKLPDKGIQIRKRVEGLRQDIDIKSKYLQGLKVKEEMPKLKLTKAKKSEQDTPDWDQLSAGVNRIQPTNATAKGMATFNAQKALTLDSLKELHGSLKSCPRANVLANDPPGLKVKLMDHQKHALAWMTWREQQRPCGGILADDMGLGKTLTMIALVLACKTRQGSGAGANSTSSDEEDEDRAKNRKSNGGWKSKGRKAAYNGGTLVVCPASLLRQWEGEVSSKMSRPRLTVCVHHGTNRETMAKQLSTYDMVVTTYNLVARDVPSKGALYGVKWRRIILDEAHVVRNHMAQSSQAVSELRGKFRWALTGTPIQNKELDVYALLKFLRCSPFDDLATWKTWIDNKSSDGQERLNLLMKSLMLRRTKAQLQLDGKLNNLPKKEIRLMEMSLDTDEMNVYQRVMTYSRTLFAQFLFQRAEKDSDSNFIKDSRKPTYNQIKDPNGAYFKMHEKFARMAGQSKEVKSHEILVLLLRLRQICCHPGLIDAMLEDDAGKMDHGGRNSYTPEIDLLAQLKKMDINNNGGSSRRSSAGADEARLAKASQNVLKRSNPVFNLKRPSSKMHKVMDILKTSVLKTKDKAIVVSQWTSVLDIMRDILQREKLVTLSLNGSIPVKDRQSIVNEFNDPRNPKRILLLSLTAGGVGLNLIGANHLILLDLHWNPQLEAQAQDRIYRVGQKKDVIIYKLVCVDTVEQQIKALQDRKLELADGVLTGKVSSKLSIDDLKGLFGM